MMSAIFDPEAQAEFDSAYDYYEAARRGYGERFADRVELTLLRIERQPTVHRLMHRDVRLALVRGFPYAILYRETKTHIRIISVFHTKRNPEEWRKRV